MSPVVDGWQILPGILGKSPTTVGSSKGEVDLCKLAYVHPTECRFSVRYLPSVEMSEVNNGLGMCRFGEKTVNEILQMSLDC